MSENKSRSVAMTQEKARAQRIARTEASLETKLTAPIVVIDALMSEIAEGDARPDLWERLHAAAVRDGQQAALSDAYAKCIAGPRMKRLGGEGQALVHMHAADWFDGVVGDESAAESHLERVLALVPGHPDAFARLERRLEKRLDARRSAELYASVAPSPPKPPTVLANQALSRILQLTAKDPLPDDALKRLVVLVPVNARLLDAMETHCRHTKRFALACELIEAALADPGNDVALAVLRRHKLIELYLGEAATPAAAITHVEDLLENDPTDAVAFKAAERLLSDRDVGSRAAAILQFARRAR